MFGNVGKNNHTLKLNKMNSQLKQIGNINLQKDAYYLCHTPSYHPSGYVIAQATIQSKNNNHKIVSLILDNGDIVDNIDILGLKRLS